LGETGGLVKGSSVLIRAALWLRSFPNRAIRNESSGNRRRFDTQFELHFSLKKGSFCRHFHIRIAIGRFRLFGVDSIWEI